MKISYKKLWKLLIDHNMKKSNLKKATGLSPATMSKLTNDESVNLTILVRICEVLKCDIGDIVHLESEVDYDR